MNFTPLNLDTIPDVFDTQQTSDLSENLIKELNPFKLRSHTSLLLKLFDLKPHLTKDEILVGLARLHKIDKKRSWVSITISNLTKKNILKKVEGQKDLFEKVKI